MNDICSLSVKRILSRLSDLDFLFSAHHATCLIDTGCRSKNKKRVIYFSLLLNSDAVKVKDLDEIVLEISCVNDGAIWLSADLSFGNGSYYKQWPKILLDELNGIESVVDALFLNMDDDITKMIGILTDK